MAGTRDEAQTLLAYNMRRLRHARGMTQEALAVAAGIRQARVSELEAGKANARLATLHAIAHALGVNVAELFEERR